MLPIMSFYTEKEYMDILNTFTRLVDQLTSSVINFDIIVTNEHLGDEDEYTLGIMLVSIPDIDGSIPVKVRLSDIVLWIAGHEMGLDVKLPMQIYKALFNPPYKIHKGVWYIVPGISGDALIECLVTSQKIIRGSYEQ